MKFPTTHLFALSLAWSFVPALSHAQTVGVDASYSGGGSTIGYAPGGTDGQSFTALSGGLSSFDFDLFAGNPGQANDPVTIEILSGAGFGGTVLASQSITLPTATDGFAGITFATPLDLVAGDVYTATITDPDLRWAINYAPDSQFTGGYGYIGQTVPQFQPYYHDYTETVFQATFGAAGSSVPESSNTLALLGGALILVAAIRRRTLGSAA